MADCFMYSGIFKRHVFLVKFILLLFYCLALWILLYILSHLHVIYDEKIMQPGYKLKFEVFFTAKDHPFTPLLNLEIVKRCQSSKLCFSVSVFC